FTSDADSGSVGAPSKQTERTPHEDLSQLLPAHQALERHFNSAPDGCDEALLEGTYHTSYAKLIRAPFASTADAAAAIRFCLENEGDTCIPPVLQRVERCLKGTSI